MKALFITADLGGNLPPTLALANALARRGLDIEIAGLPQGRTRFTQRHYPPSLATTSEYGGRGLRKTSGMVRLVAGRGASRLSAALVARSRPNVVIVDCLLAAPLRGALAGGARVAVLFHSFGGFFYGRFDRGVPGRALWALGLRPRTLWRSAAARIVLADPELDPMSGVREMRDFTWVGTAEQGAEPLDRGTRPRVLVALSSTDWPGMLGVYRRTIAALSTLPVDAVVTTGGVDLGGELTGAPNVEVRGWAPHEGMLPAMDLVIGHGGHSTTMRALAHGVPLLLLPINPISDQRLIADTLAAAGLATVLSRSAGAARIREAIATTLADTALRRNAAAAGERLRRSPAGADVAAARIMALLKAGS
ncbi:glycosyltransferase [Leucobacter komagatae]|uniref:glycosyltransferase n=1 Tax=Leucobacter komagatae TaxID=55969 RepID=UPI000697F529|nr:nucleotide disphospho-sugar-binding domain-containing protein [Leucobacter komagatae]